MAHELIPLELELFPQPKGCGNKTVRAEVNMLNFPFFLLTNRDGHKRADTVYEFEEQVGQEKVRRVWRVTASNRFGHPVPYDKNVFRAIEAIIDSQGYPVQNPVKFSTYELLKKMGEGIGGRQYDLVRQSINRIVATTIIAENVFWRKARRSWHTETFHIYERCVHQGEQVEGGRMADKNHLYLHHLYLESINARFVKPLDYEYYKGLERPMAKRLYELLGYKFYGAIKNDSEMLIFHYNTLCQLLPMKPQPYLSLAKRCLTPAHEELIRTGFLADVTWAKWKIYYTAGPRMFREIQSLEGGEDSDPGSQLAIERLPS